MTLTTSDYHYHLVNFTRNNHNVQLSFASKFQLLIDYDRYKKLILFTLLSNDRTVNTTDLSTKDCYLGKELVKSNTLQQTAHPSGRCTSVCTSSSDNRMHFFKHRKIIVLNSYLCFIE